MNKLTRRDFFAPVLAASIGLSFVKKTNTNIKSMKGKRVGIIGLDTSHSVAFTKSLHRGDAAFKGYKVVAAYPKGSLDIVSSTERIPGYIEDVKKMGVEIVSSISELLKKVDVVLLETNDGRRHLEQAVEVFKSGKRTFIDKPIAASLKDAQAIFEAADKYGVPTFSASSLRFATGMMETKNGSIGKISGADTFSPMKFEKTHPDLFWYGIHGVEMLFTVMGTGCESVQRTIGEDQEVVTGIWKDGRIGTFRGIKNGKQNYGGTAFGENGINPLGPYNGYDPLLIEIINFFESGIAPVDKNETLEMCAFMMAADESKKKGGASVSLKEVGL
ncbi:Gfo/Idh/MocA family protein [Arcticibacterium luteifluviistationis]|uniref:Dehydrogenase n=1 Tax=Arcticibacterium luteifluviistationis TaxID=1784714 RepID=A0A2Z4GI36_9BACT|nr:Gfo/Idh/MocA family oxidoreductase [Arcticibacterium luteifluviistationis]AWW00748.1 dehydrogenase [Arcticibacterium luteifluviistationis]